MPALTNALVQTFLGDCLHTLPRLPPHSVDSVITDPPYGLKFMGKCWDHGVPGIPFWKEILRVAKPGAHLLAFGGTRTYHRLTCAIEDAGWEVRDCLMFLYGVGFPKSHDVSKAIDREAGAERKVVGKKGGRYASPKQDFRGGKHHSGADTQKTGMFNAITAPATPEAEKWQGWGSALKPSYETILLCRKPLEGTIAGNVLKHGTGGLNIDGCRIWTNDHLKPRACGSPAAEGYRLHKRQEDWTPNSTGRWPANLILDEEAAKLLDEMTGQRKGDSIGRKPRIKAADKFGWSGPASSDHQTNGYTDSGGVSRFFYCAKASKKDRGEDNSHPTTKPTSLMQWLCRLVTPPGGLILDPFMGSGSTGVAALREGFRFLGIEENAEYLAIARARLRREREALSGHAISSP